MANTIEFSQVLQAKLDEQVVRLATTGWMEANAGQVKYNGGNEVKIPKLNTQGLADYSRDGTGFVKGDINLATQTRTLTQDRGRGFTLNSMDVDETNFVTTASTVMGHFQADWVVPEIDAYRYTKLHNEAGTKNTATLTTQNALTTLLNDLTALEDGIGTGQLIITVSSLTLNKLQQDLQFRNLVADAVLKQGNYDITLKSINGHILRVVPSRLLNTQITLRDGKTAGQLDGGFLPAGQKVNWLICPANVPLAISKTDKLRIFSPDEYQEDDAWFMRYRKYHDLWVLDNQKVKVLSNAEPGA